MDNYFSAKSKLNFIKKLYNLLLFVCFTTSISAQIIYTDIDPDNGNPYLIDMDNDGSADFHFNKTTGALEFAYIQSGGGLSPGDNEVVAIGPGPLRQVLALDSGAVIDDTQPFEIIDGGNLKLVTELPDFSTTGLWLGIGEAYMGVRFDLGGTDVFGWVHIGITDDNKIATLFDYAYEVSGGLIVAGELPVVLVCETPTDLTVLRQLRVLILGGQRIEVQHLGKLNMDKKVLLLGLERLW